MILLPQKVAYRGTESIRISSADGTAFIDGASEAITALADGNHLIEIYDASGNQLKGYLSAAGDGEGLGDELHVSANAASDPNGNEANATIGWNAYGGGSPSISSAATDPAVGTYHLRGVAGSQFTGISRDNTTIAGRLYNISGSLRSVIGTTTVGYWNAGFSASLGSGAARSANGYLAYSDYRTAIGTSIINIFTNNVATTGEFYVDNYSFKQVLAPSTAGCLIVSTKGGATQSFATVQAGFAYNAAAYSVVVRKAR